MSAISGFCEKCNKFRKRHCDGNRNTCMTILFDKIEILQDENKVFKNCYDTAKTTIEALQQENEQLKEQINTAKIGWDTYKTYSEQLQAKLDEWKYEAKCHMDEVAARDKEIERLKAQVDTLSATVNMLAPDEIGKECRHIEALRKAREEAQNALDNYELVGEHEYDISEHLQIALVAIDKAIGGKEDV